MQGRWFFLGDLWAQAVFLTLIGKVGMPPLTAPRCIRSLQSMALAPLPTRNSPRAAGAAPRKAHEQAKRRLSKERSGIKQIGPPVHGVDLASAPRGGHGISRRPQFCRHAASRVVCSAADAAASFALKLSTGQSLRNQLHVGLLIEWEWGGGRHGRGLHSLRPLTASGAGLSSRRITLPVTVLAKRVQKRQPRAR